MKVVSDPMMLHKEYKVSTFENDIAVLTLESPLERQPHIAPVCLPQPEAQLVGKKAFVTGWGKTKYGE